MKKLIKYSSVFLLSTLLLGSCARIKTSNTVGDWHHEISRNMGGYNISSKSKLTIIRIEAGVYEYKLAITTTDQMYGGIPKTKYSSGKFEEYINENKWVFSGGEFGLRGGYIEVPSDDWDDYKPKTLSVYFASGQGNSMIFSRSNGKPRNINNASEEESKTAYKQGYSDGQMGYGLPASEKATAIESYMAHNYNFSSADFLVYQMGYNDAIAGNIAEY